MAGVGLVRTADPGGSLWDQLRCARIVRRTAQPWPLSRPYWLLAAGAAAVVLGIVAIVQLDALAAVGAVLIAAGAAAAAAGGWVLRGDVRADAELRTQIRRERMLARELEGLTALGWRVLHDRFLPGGHHRVPHLVVGPAGVFVVTPLPAGPLQLVGNPPSPGGNDPRQLYAGPAASSAGASGARCSSAHCWYSPAGAGSTRVLTSIWVTGRSGPASP